MFTKTDLEDTRAIRREATRERVLQAAWELARRDGLAAITLREVARQVGMRAPSLYTYFESKNAMYDAMYAQAAQELAATLARRPHASDPRQTLRGRMRLFIAFCVADPVRYQLLLERPIPGFEPAPESFQITVGALAATRADLEAAGVHGEPAVDMFRALITGLVSLQVANDPGGDRWTRLQDSAFDMLLAHYATNTHGPPQHPGKDYEQLTVTSQPSAPSTADAFGQSHQGRMHSAAVDLIYRSAFGADYPAAAQPNAFYSATTLQRVISTLDLRPGRVLADLGCGHGGPGLWAAQQTGATLIGIDLSPAGVELARRRAAQLGLDRRASFTAGDLAATGLPDASCDAVMSLDVLLFVPDKAAAVREVARILRPGGRFAFTTWERMGRPAGDDPQRQALADTFQSHPLLESARADYRQLIQDAGLDLEIFEEPAGWRRQQQALAEGIIAAEAEVTADMGLHYPAMARVFLADLPGLRYVFAVARHADVRRS